MKKIITLFTLIATIGLVAVTGATKQYTADEMADLLNDLVAAENGDVFELTTSGGLYKVDSMSLEIHANITIKAAADLQAKPIIKLVKSDHAAGQVDYLVRLKAADVSLVLEGLEFQGDSLNTKYAIRTAKIGDLTSYTGYDDPTYNGEDVVQWYDLTIRNCGINGIKKGSDGRGIIMYPATRARLLKIENTTFSAIERDGINAYCDTDDLNANGHWLFADSIAVLNSTFHHVGREAIQIRSSDTSETSGLHKVFIDHVTFDSCAWNNNDPGKYHTLKIDYIQATITNCIFTNDISDDYITRIYNPNASTNYIGINNLGGVDPGNGLPDPEIKMADTIKTKNGSVFGEMLWMGDPLYANSAAGDYTLDATSPFLTKASDGWALGDLRWDPTKVAANNAELTEIKVDDAALPDFEAAKLDYRLELPEGTTAVPTVSAAALSPAATVDVTQAPDLPGTANVVVTAEDGETKKTYTVFLFAKESEPDAIDKTVLDAVSIYPNPSNGSFTIANNSGANINVYNVAGKVVYQQEDINSNQLIVTNLTKGLYFVAVQFENELKVGKIIVE